ncbi:MAG: hypothetical protein JSV17_18580 [Candidatus Aminicenantes bacterium]|nr:MAG: hypothetical protein JSV17_18580 [Candidatus Aminicenantes bacterium]
MRKRTMILSLCMFLCLGFLTVCTSSTNVETQADKSGQEVFTGNALLTTTAAGGATTRLTITIEEYTSDEDIMKYIDILKTEGPEGLRKVLEKVQKGWIAPTGKVRDTVNLARSRPFEGGRLINLLKTRHFKFIEFARSTPRSREYEFTFIQLKLDEEGNGEGYMFAGTKIEFDKEGKLVLEQRGTAPILIRGVNQRK